MILILTVVFDLIPAIMLICDIFAEVEKNEQIERDNH